MNFVNVSQLAGLGDLFNNLIAKIKEIIISPIVIILYGLQQGFFYLIDCVQEVFRSMAGLSHYYYQGEEMEGDMVMSLLMDQTIVNIFWAVLVVAIMLLFVTTIVAVIRSEFSDKNAKGPIISRSIKAIAYFAVVPVACLLGVWISNVFLRSFDKATNLQSSSLSSTIFFAAAHDANRVRNGDSTLIDKITHDSELLKAFNASASDDKNTLATKIDQAFLKQSPTIKGSLDTSKLNYMFVMGGIWGTNSETFTHYHMGVVYYFYDLFGHYNFLIGYVGGFTAAMLLLQSCLALIQRLYELALLFVISPAFIAFMPLDDGAKYKGWCAQFTKRVGMAYGPIIGMNLMFIILSRLQDVNVFDPNDHIGSMFNAIMQGVFMIVGLIAVKEFSGLISSLIGADDAAKNGKAMSDNVMQMGKKMTSGTLVAGKMGANIIGGAGKSVKRKLTGEIKNAREDEKTASNEASQADEELKQAKAALDANPNDATAKQNYERAQAKQEQASKKKEDAEKARKVAEDGTFQGGLRSLRDGYAENGLRGTAEAFEKTRLGTNYSLLAQYAGLDGYMTKKGRDKAAEDGKSFLGDLSVGFAKDENGNWGLAKSRREKIGAEKKAKEAKDEAKQQKEADKAVQAQANATANALSGVMPQTPASAGTVNASSGGTGNAGTGSGSATGVSNLAVNKATVEAQETNVKDSKFWQNSLDQAQKGLEEAQQQRANLGDVSTTDGTLFWHTDKNGKTTAINKTQYDKAKAEQDEADQIVNDLQDVVDFNAKQYKKSKQKVLDGQEDADNAKEDVDNFKALADLIAQAIANAQLKTKTSFDPGQQLDIRKIDGEVNVKTEQDLIDDLGEIKSIVRGMGTDMKVILSGKSVTGRDIRLS